MTKYMDTITPTKFYPGQKWIKFVEKFFFRSFLLNSGHTNSFSANKYKLLQLNEVEEEYSNSLALKVLK